jgi:hypothetical protein
MAVRVILLVHRILKPIVFLEIQGVFVCFWRESVSVGKELLIHEVS